MALKLYLMSGFDLEKPDHENMTLKKKTMTSTGMVISSRLVFASFQCFYLPPTTH